MANCPNSEQQPLQRSKYLIGQAAIGLYVAGSKEKAQESLVTLAKLACVSGLYPDLSVLALVRDLNGSRPASLRGAFVQRMSDFASQIGTDYAILSEVPAWLQVGRLQVGQVLLRDPVYGPFPVHAVEDHVLRFLEEQPDRNPGHLAKVVEGALGRALGQKQRVQLAMILDNCCNYPTGFYERVTEAVPEAQIRALGESLGLAALVAGLCSAPPASA